MCICVSVWAYAMCIQAPTKARRGHQISWSWSYRLLWAACNGYWEWRDFCKRSKHSGLLGWLQRHLSKHNSMSVGTKHYQALINPGRAHCFLSPWESMQHLTHFFFKSVFLWIRCENSKPLLNATCTRNISPVSELACSRPQLLTFIKLYFMKILLQKAHDTVRCVLFPSNRWNS